ncbi:MAG: aminopeptidase P family protein [Deltaproteobacteria bacterium]|nr:aminopeptidase P family protein [Deltaproteobacteria bacterium]
MVLDGRPTAEELRSRTRRFQGHLREQGLGGAVLVQNVDRYYFSGTMQMGHVVVPADGDPLILIRRDPRRAAAESPLAVEPLESVRDVAARVRDRLGDIPSPLGLERDVLPAAQLDRLQSLFPGVPFGDASRALLLTRAIKSPAEIEAVRRAGRLVAEAVAEVPRFLREGVTELELSALIEFELRRRGHGGLIRTRGFNQEMFYGHVFAGATAAAVSFLDAPTGGAGLGPALPYGPSPRPIGRGEPVSVDLVGNVQGYLADQTRVFALGRVEEVFAEAFEAALAVHEAVLAEARPGVPASRLYDVALQAAAETPFAAHFLGERHKVGFVGHGIGLEVDEYPFLARGFDLPLAEGMVFALEPKFIFEGRGVVGVEDTFAITAEGVERLTTSPQELMVVEE